MDKSFSNGNAPNCGASVGNAPASPATITICGNRLGAGDNHWAMQV